METTICDKCNNYEVSLSGTLTTCHAVKYDSDLELAYFLDRENGIKSQCKRYKKLGEIENGKK